MTDATRAPDEDDDAGKQQAFGIRRLVRVLLADDIFQDVRERLITNMSRFADERLIVVWGLSILIGLGVGYAALAFRLVLGWVQWLWLGTREEAILEAVAQTPWFVILLAPVIGGLVVGVLLDRFVPTKRVHGVADVIEARAISDSKVDTQTGLWSALIAAISLGSGASAGREGPVVHLGATIASFIQSRFKLDGFCRSTLLACGGAAAVSASFNAPIAGVLFAHEVILAHYSLRAFVPVVIASVVGGVIVRLHLGNAPTFFVPDYGITSFFEFPAFALLGLTCAAVAILFEVTIMATERRASELTMPLWLRPALGGLVIGATGIFLPEILGVGYGATDLALQQKLPLALLFTLIFAKTILTAITLASRFGGGIFSPALYLGAMTGGAFGILATSAFPEFASSGGLYVLLGMGGVAAAVLGAPISTTVMVFELTGGYEMTIALLLTVSISNGVTQAALGHSIFHWQLTRRGLSLADGPHREIMQRMTVATFMVPLGAEEPQPELPEGDAAETDTLKPGDSIERALRTFDRIGETRIPVVSAVDATKVIAWADQVAAVSALNRALIARSRDEHR
ncbi:MAG: chloride channel protein [Pseudomonadota bacterium]